MTRLVLLAIVIVLLVIALFAMVARVPSSETSSIQLVNAPEDLSPSPPLQHLLERDSLPDTERLSLERASRALGGNAAVAGQTPTKSLEEKYANYDRAELLAAQEVLYKKWCEGAEKLTKERLDAGHGVVEHFDRRDEIPIQSRDTGSSADLQAVRLKMKENALGGFDVRRVMIAGEQEPVLLDIELELQFVNRRVEALQPR